MYPSKISLAEINVLRQKQGIYLSTQAASPPSDRVFAGHYIKPLREESNSLNIKKIDGREKAKVMFSEHVIYKYKRYLYYLITVCVTSWHLFMMQRTVRIITSK